MSLPLVAVHGGAGTIDPAHAREAGDEYRRALDAVLRAAAQVLDGGSTALDAVTEAVCRLEDEPLFNAGRGSVYSDAGRIEMDAALMDGERVRAGAVAGSTRLRNPVRGARAVLELTGCVLMTGEAVERLAAQAGLALEPPEYFHTQARWDEWQRARARGATPMLDHDAAFAPRDTVGAVALDARGHLAAAVSTGGLTNKRSGRIGDSPIVGAGCYANDRSCAVACTGTGETFVLAAAAYDVHARMRYAGMDLEAAARATIDESVASLQGHGGLVAIDAGGGIAMPFNTSGMYRGFRRAGERPHVAIHRETPRPLDGA